MTGDFLVFIVSLILMTWILRHVEYYLWQFFVTVNEKIMCILERFVPDRAFVPGSPAYEEGNILFHDCKLGSWVVLGYTPEKGYRLSDEEGKKTTVSQLEVEISYFIPFPRSHESRYSDQ